MSEEMEYQESPVEDLGATPEVTEGESGTPETVETEVATDAVDDGATDERKGRGIQKRIDELVRQREEARREAEAWRDVATRQPAPPTEAQREMTQYADLPKPNSDDYDTYDQYVEAVADWKADVKLRQVHDAQQMQSRAQTLKSWHEQAAAKYSDWKEVFTGDLNISPGMAAVMLDSDQGIELGYYLAKNPHEATRIFNLPAHRQAYELGKIEVKLSAPPQRSTTKAPAPTSPVGGRDIAAKKPDDMDYEEYKAWRASGGGR